jgi:hypothetical protein
VSGDGGSFDVLDAFDHETKVMVGAFLSADEVHFALNNLSGEVETLLHGEVDIDIGIFALNLCAHRLVTCIIYLKIDRCNALIALQVTMLPE